jgi:hypothetical protein
MLKVDEIPAFDTATLGATARAPLAVGRRTYHSILLQAEGLGAGGAGTVDVRNAIEYVELFVSGKSALMLKPALHMYYLDHLNATSDPIPSSFLHIPLSQPGILESDWATGDMESLQIAVKLKSAAGLPVGATFTRIKGWATYEDLAAPVPRGNVFTQMVISPNSPVAGWNTIDNLTVGSLVALRRLVFLCPPAGTLTVNPNASAITQVKISIAGELVCNLTRDSVACHLAHNPYYKAPASVSYIGFPVFLDLTNRVSDLAAVVNGNVRQPVKVEYFWDSGAFAPTPFEILVDGLQLGVSRPIVAAQ